MPRRLRQGQALWQYHASGGLGQLEEHVGVVLHAGERPRAGAIGGQRDVRGGVNRAVARHLASHQELAVHVARHRVFGDAASAASARMHASGRRMRCCEMRPPGGVGGSWDVTGG